MYSPITLIRKYLTYYLTASNGKGHGIHSPFVFELVTQVLNDNKKYYAYTAIEEMRQRMLHDHTVINVDDKGAGSVVSRSAQRKISTIARTALKPKKFGQLLFRMVNHYQPNTILELGTSLGITTAYLGAARSGSRLVSIEGSDAIANQAAINLGKLGITNVHLVKGDFDEVLKPLLERLSAVDFAFVDGNHRKEPTLRYFEEILRFSHPNTILVFDDIHWSREMEEAWAAICRHPLVRCTVDLFFVGMVFLRPEFKTRLHFTIRF